MGRRSAVIAAVLGGLLWGLWAPAGARAADTIEIDVMVSLISQDPGEVDPRAERLDAKLRSEFRYESLEVLSQRKVRVALNDLAKVSLPDGNELMLRPLSLSDHGVLVAVTVEGSVRSDLQIQNGHLVAIGAGRYQNGKLVISLEPRF